MFELITIIIISYIITLIISIRLTYNIEKIDYDNHDLVKTLEFKSSIITLIQLINLAFIMLLILDINKGEKNEVIIEESNIIECVDTLSVIKKPNIEIINDN